MGFVLYFIIVQSRPAHVIFQPAIQNKFALSLNIDYTHFILINSNIYYRFFKSYLVHYCLKVQKEVAIAKIEWTDKFSVNNEEIDNQHKKWISIYNTAHEKMITANPGENLQHIGATAMKDMIDYGKYHFSHEEKHMEKIGFSDLKQHRAIHSDFAAKLDRMASDINQGKLVLNSEIIKTIENWLVNHILSEDQKYKQ